MTRFCPHCSVHRGYASHSQINIESTCEKKSHAQPHIQTNTATNMYRNLETLSVIVTLAGFIVMVITKHRYIPLQKIIIIIILEQRSVCLGRMAKYYSWNLWNTLSSCWDLSLSPKNKTDYNKYLNKIPISIAKGAVTFVAFYYHCEDCIFNIASLKLYPFVLLAMEK